ncbi:FAD-binding monooxygenase [Enterobacteriaceae bacterium 4M9]|nr:FAD-binding monooxygenase [Enterobacteriaceae bacterium 4M9]
MTTCTSGFSRAIVIGASVAGCLTARVLARHFDEVLLLDQDTFSTDPAPRKTVPQEHHVHLLLNRGSAIIEALYPGFKNALLNAGAQEIDLCHGVKCYAGKAWKQRWPTGITAHYCSRTLLEFVLRQQTMGVENVKIIDGVRVKGLLHDAGRVSGVQVTVDGDARELEATLVVDACGRSSRTSAWLKQFGYGDVLREEVANQLGYVSRIYRRNPARNPGWQVLLVTPDLPQRRNMGVISPIEGDRFMVTAGGWFGASPLPNEDDFMRFLAELPVPDIYNEVSQLEPVGGFHPFKMPCSLRRRYDLMPNWPQGLLVVGDALCSINPIYSQGMSVSALQVEALARVLPAFLRGDIWAQQVLSAQIDATDISWQQAKANDESLRPQASRVGLKARLHARWLGVVNAAAFHNRDVAMATLNIANLVADKRTLYSLPVARASLLSAIARVLR